MGHHCDCYLASCGICNKETEVIKSEAECTIALTNLGYKISKTYWRGHKRNIPYGCSIRTLNDRPYFNTFDLGKGRDDMRPICKGKSQDRM